MHSREQLDFCSYRLEKARVFLSDAKKTLELGMFETAANRSYYSIFHAVRALLALESVDFKKHSGVISYFQMTYIKTKLLPVEMSNILKSAFSLRSESDYKDFYIIAHDDVVQQVEDAEYFLKKIEEYISNEIAEDGGSN